MVNSICGLIDDCCYLYLVFPTLMPSIQCWWMSMWEIPASQRTLWTTISYYLIRFSTICGLVDGWCCLYVVIEHWFEMVLAGLGLQCRAWCPRDHDVCINVSCLFYRMKHWLWPNTGTPIKLPLFHVWKKCLLILSEKWKQLNPPEPLAPFPAGICDRASLMDFGF